MQAFNYAGDIVRMNLTQIGIVIVIAGMMILLVDFILPSSFHDTAGTGTLSTSVVTSTVHVYATIIAHDGMNVSNLMIQNISYRNATVSGFLDTLPPTNAPEHVVLHLGGMIGYGCYLYPSMTLEGINANGTAVFLQTSQPGGACPN